jgi:Lon protease-like protein
MTQTNLPLFPLPNVVVQPGVIMPLHIFEERYRNMIEDAALFDNKIILSYAEKMLGNNYLPSQYSTVCIIDKIKELTDGRKDIIIVGIDYVKINLVNDSDRLYKLANIDYLPIDEHLTNQTSLYYKTKISSIINRIHLLTLNYQPIALNFFNKERNLHYFVNNISHYYLKPIALQQSFLEERTLEKKCQLMLEYLTKVANELEKDIKNFIIPKNMERFLN